MVPAIRITPKNDHPIDPAAGFVLYWMIAARRRRSNFALEHAVDHARALAKPLVILEAVGLDYPYASDRLHAFLIDGMSANATDFARSAALYYPYVEPARGAGRGLLAALSAHAAVVVTDDYPSAGLPQVVTAAARVSRVRMEAVDGNGLLPLRSTERVFPTAFAFRRFLQQTMLEAFPEQPVADPLAAVRLPRLTLLPAAITRRYPAAPRELLDRDPRQWSRLPIDHVVGPTALRGGSIAGRRQLDRFLDQRFDRYIEDRDHPDRGGGSGLSPYLHFGHVGSHDVLGAILDREGWTSERTARKATGKRAGFLGLSPAAEAFFDQLITWREVGFHMTKRPGHERYDSLPNWARLTLARHAADPRPHLYDRDQFALARTHDPLWNAAQRQLVRDGTIHNYLRMLWGKKILEWSPSPEAALAVMLELNDRYALDGRDPNSLSGIFWILGRFDRAWGPERPIYGTVRYMSSANTARKLRVQQYLQRHAE